MAKTVMIIRHGEKPGKDGEHPCGVDHEGVVDSANLGRPLRIASLRTRSGGARDREC